MISSGGAEHPPEQAPPPVDVSEADPDIVADPPAPDHPNYNGAAADTIEDRVRGNGRPVNSFAGARLVRERRPSQQDRLDRGVMASWIGDLIRR